MKEIRRGYMTHHLSHEGGNKCHALNAEGGALCGTWMSMRLNEADPVKPDTPFDQLQFYIDCQRCLKKLRAAFPPNG